jgi:hypothetical protein
MSPARTGLPPKMTKKTLWSARLRGPFGAYKTRLRTDCLPQRFSVYQIPTYWDRRLLRDNVAGKLMCFTTGQDAVFFPDIDNKDIGTDIDVDAVCERLNGDHSLAARCVWGPGYNVAKDRWMGFLMKVLVYPVGIPLAWWLQSYIFGGGRLQNLVGSQFAQSAAAPFILTAGTWFVLLNICTFALMVVYVTLSVREGTKAAAK